MTDEHACKCQEPSAEDFERALEVIASGRSTPCRRTVVAALREAKERRTAVCAKNARTEPDAGREAAIEAVVDAYDAERIRIWNLGNGIGGTAPMSVRNRQFIRPMIAAAITAYEAHRGGGAVRDLLQRIAATAIWQDTYPDGPDIMDGRYDVTPVDVRICRSAVEVKP